jgi:hypothetical protein
MRVESAAKELERNQAQLSLVTAVDERNPSHNK